MEAGSDLHMEAPAKASVWAPTMTSLVVSITQPFSLIGVSLSETNLVCCMAEDPCSDVGMSVTVRYAAI